MTSPAPAPGVPEDTGLPSLRALAPSIVGGAVVPLVVYFLVKKHVHSDAEALAIAGIFPALWVLVSWVRRRQLEPIGSIVLFGFIVGLIASAILGGNAFVLKIRETLFTGIFGIVCLFSIRWQRPMMFYFGRAISAGGDPERVAAYNELFELPTAPRIFRIITACWGVGFLLETGVRISLAASLSTGVFLAVSPIATGVIYGSLFVFTFSYTKRARARAEALYGTEAEPGEVTGEEPALG